MNIIINALLIALWCRIWTGNSRISFFNPYIVSINKFVDKIIDFLSPVFLKAPVRLIPLVTIIFIIVFRGMAIMSTTYKQGPNAAWHVTFGHQTAYIAAGPVKYFIIFSFVSFAIFLFNVWCLATLYARPSKSEHMDRPQGVLHYLALPFSSLPQKLRIVAIITLGLLIGFTYHLSEILEGISTPDIAAIALSCAKLTLAGFVGVLQLISKMLMLLVIATWVGSFAQSREIHRTANEWLRLLLGPMRSRPLVIGFIDLTPLIMSFALNYLSGVLLQIIAVL